MRLPRHDVIVTMTDPPMQLLLGPVLKAFRGGRLIHWAQDVYPELAEELGVIKKQGLLATTLRALSTWALKRHDAVVCIGRCMKQKLIERGVEERRIHVIPNWADVEAIHPLQENYFLEKHGLNGKQIVMYSGNMGLAHPFEAMFDSAQSLAATHPNVHFVFIGDGPKRGKLVSEVEKRELCNVLFLPFQEKGGLSESLGAADIHLACMNDSLLGLVVPSKVYGIMAAGRPCIFLGPETCEVSRLIQECHCGEVIPSHNGERLTEVISHWLDDANARVQAGKYARRAAEKFSLSHAVSAFADVRSFHNRIEGNGSLD